MGFLFRSLTISRWYRLYSRLERWCKRNGITRRLNKLFNILLIYLVYVAIRICIESFDLNEPLWHVTRYRLNTYFHSDPFTDLYFNPIPDHKEPLVHENIRILLRDEYLKELKESALNYTIYFDDLNEKVVESTEDSSKLKFNLSYYNNDDDYIHNNNMAFREFIQDFSDLTFDNLLRFPNPERIITNSGKPVIWDTIFLDDAYSRVSYNYLSKLMEFDDIFLLDLKLKHQIVVNSLPSTNCPFYKGSGYVFIGGSTYSWYSLLSIQSLRKSGSTKPIELIIPNKNDVDLLLCNEVLPIYNAKCVILDEIYPKKVLNKFNASGYQLKSLAILASSFENTIYLDSDVFSVKNPDKLFESELFKKYGMITWPDFWRRTTSPKLYESLGVEFDWKPVRFLNDYFTPSDLLYKPEDIENPKDKINLHDLKGTLPDWSTEAGLLVINKATHFNTLLLSLYYNINGPAGYYPLLSQGGAGEGDKETLPLAAHMLNQTWWQVNKQPGKTYGTWIKDRNWIVDSSIIQVDPLEDWEGILGLTWTQEHWRNEMIDRGGYVYNYDYSFGKEGYAYSEIMGAALGNGGMASFVKGGEKYWEPMYDDDMEKNKHYPVPMLSKPSDMFYHVHSPKIDPWHYVLDDLFTDMYYKQMRNFGTVWSRLGWDFETWVWETIREDLCGYNKDIPSVNGLTSDQIQIVNKAIKELKCFQGRDYDSVCYGEKGRLDKRIKWLKKDGETVLKSEGKPLTGWKLRGEERRRIEQIVESSWNDGN